MDPLLVAVSVVGLPAAGNKVGLLLSTKCKGSPSLAAGINEGVADISDALYRLQDLVSGRSKAVAKRGSQIQLDQLLTTLTGCVMTYSDLQQFIHTSPNINEGMRTSDCINTFVQRLQSYKFSLKLMLTIIQCESIKEAQSCARKLCDLVEQLLESYLDLAKRMQGLEYEGSIISKARLEINPVDDTSTIYRASTTRESMLQLGHAPVKRLAFEDALELSYVYKKAIYGHLQLSITSSALYSTALLVFSKLSLDRVSKISFYALPVCAVDLNNSDFYIFGEEGAVLLDLPATPTTRGEDQDRQSPVNNEPTPKPAHSDIASPTAKLKRSGLLGRFAARRRRPLTVSTPTNPLHVQHISIDGATGEFEGLPREWQRLLEPQRLLERRAILERDASLKQKQ